jgi:hypothetical protein
VVLLGYLFNLQTTAAVPHLTRPGGGQAAAGAERESNEQRCDTTRARATTEAPRHLIIEELITNNRHKNSELMNELIESADSRTAARRVQCQ